MRCIMPATSGYREDARRRRALGSSPAAPAWHRYVFARSSSPKPGEPVLQARRLDLVERHPVHAWRALVGARQIV